MKSIDHIGQEFFRFEMATAVAGSVLGINPFNQPDVEAAKIKTRELTAAFEKTGSLPKEDPVMSTRDADIYTDDKNAADLRKAGANGDLGSWLKAHLARSGADDYVALLAYIERDAGAYRHAAAHAARGARPSAMSRPARNSARASCIPPARPIRADPTAACSCRSPPMTPAISRCRARRRASASSRPRRRVAISAC